MVLWGAGVVVVFGDFNGFVTLQSNKVTGSNALLHKEGLITDTMITDCHKSIATHHPERGGTDH